MTIHWSGSIVPMEAMTLEDDQSCQALNPAWRANTVSRTHARAKLATAGGFPSGFHAMKTNILATRRIEPKPPKRYPTMRPRSPEGGGVSLFLPFSPTRRRTSSLDRPCVEVTDKRRKMSSREILCHSRPTKSIGVNRTASQKQNEPLTNSSPFLCTLNSILLLLKALVNFDGAMYTHQQWSHAMIRSAYSVR